MMLFKHTRNLAGSPSIFLDSLRIISALTVLYVHASEQIGVYYASPDVGHIAVIVFFVLSGYVIAYTTTKNNRGRVQYAAARLSRLYSIVLPAIFFTALVQIIVWKIDPTVNLTYSRGASTPRYILTSFFLNEIWFYSASPPINGPLWSLSFEFWYYVIFGAFFFRKGNTLKSLLLPLIVCFIAGPKILIMMPIWLAGNYAYHFKMPNISTKASWSLVFCALSIGVLCIVYLPPLPKQLGTYPFFFASQFLTDWVIGIFIAVAFWLLPTGKVVKRGGDKKWVKVFRQFADLTFPIYVLHMPLLVLWRAIFGTKLYDLPQMFTAFFTVLIICMLIGIVLEKYRYIWTNFFSHILTYFKVLFQRAPWKYKPTQ